MRTYMKVFCSKCKKEIKGNKGYYIQIVNRANRKKRESGIICENCYKNITKK